MGIIPLLLFLLLASCDALNIVGNWTVHISVLADSNDSSNRFIKSARSRSVMVDVLSKTDNAWSIWMEEKCTNAGKEGEMIMFLNGAVDLAWVRELKELIDGFTGYFPGNRIVLSHSTSNSTDDAHIGSAEERLPAAMIGYAREICKLTKEMDQKHSDNSYVLFLNLVSNEALKSTSEVGFDDKSLLFLNVDVHQDNVEVKFDENGKGYIHNSATGKKPVIVYGSSSVEGSVLNRMSDYIDEWNNITGCALCNKRKEYEMEMENKGESMELPFITMAVFIHKCVPFIDEILSSIFQQDYPKSKINLLFFNGNECHLKEGREWFAREMHFFKTSHMITSREGIFLNDARQLALEETTLNKSEFLFSVDADSIFTNPSALRTLVTKSLFYQKTRVLSTVVSVKNGLWSNFWGQTTSIGLYKRSFDYIDIVEGKRRGLWNVAHISSPLLIQSSLVEHFKDDKVFERKGDNDLLFSAYLREKSIFMYVTNEDEAGYIVEDEGFEQMMKADKKHPLLWQITTNPELWEKYYLHEGYTQMMLKDWSDIHQPCPEVFDVPLLSPRFCAEIIEEMEHFGQWSGGKHEDERIAGGYENVPTVDIHMNQLGFEKEWLLFLEKYARPVQRKVFYGYSQKVHAEMMFVVRYRPQEQSFLRPHNDASTYSIDIALNQKGKDYEGGGVRFTRHNCTVAADEVGYGMFFPGFTHQHEGLPTTDGTRYILVSFVNPY